MPREMRRALMTGGVTPVEQPRVEVADLPTAGGKSRIGFLQ